MTHLVIEGSLQWIIGRNVTRKTDIIHLNRNYIRFRHTPGQSYSTVQLIDHGDHSFIPKHKFIHGNFISVNDTDTGALCIHSATVSNHDVGKIIKRAHEHVCRHASYDDMRILLQRNNLWADNTKNILLSIIENCPHCIITKAPTGLRPVSLSRINSRFNESVCVDHIFLDGIIIFHVMDKATRYSVAAIVESTKISEAIIVFDTTWVNQYWSLGTLFGDQAFNTEAFKSHLNFHNIKFNPIPARRHNKNAIESKHRVIRDIYLRLKAHHPNIPTQLLAINAIRVSNDLYGNDIASSYELAHGYTRPLLSSAPTLLPPDIVKAHKDPIAKRKLNLILRSHAIKENRINTGDLVQVFVKKENVKRGSWSQPRPVLQYDHNSRTVTVAGKGGKYLEVEIEDVRHALAPHALTQILQEAMDVCDESVTDAITTVSDSPRHEYPIIGTVAGIDDLSEVNNSSPMRYPMTDQYLTYTPCVEALQSAQIELLPGTSLSSSIQQDLCSYESRFGSKEFMKHEAEGLPSHIIHNSYATEETAFLKSCTKITDQRFLTMRMS